MLRMLQTAPATLALIVVVLVSTLPAASLQAQPVPPASETLMLAQVGTNQTYLPLVQTPPGPPQFTISNPAPGSTIGGTVIVAVQPLLASSLSSVSFQAGSLDLGTDETSANGFQAFLDVRNLPAGPVTITATGRGPQGTASQSVAVIAQPAPPSSGSIGAQGGVLGTTSGATISIPPGAVDSDTSISIRERSQAEVTSEAGIAWDDIGVTFLGDVAIDTSQPLARPVGISTQGFANRIQPGQAVVTYNLLPDQDGDGVGELVVASMAEVAPNGAITSAPASGTVVRGVSNVISNAPNQAMLAQGGIISGPPGMILEIEVNGFNINSAYGNVGVFRSAVNGEEIEIAGIVTIDTSNPGGQIFSIQIPPLPAGAATLVLRNKSSGLETDAINLQVTQLSLDRPATQIIDDFFSGALAAIEQVPSAERVATTRAFTDTWAALRDLYGDSSATTQQYLNDVATTILGSGALNPSSGLSSAGLAANNLQLFGRCFPKSDSPWSGRNGFKNSTLIIMTALGIAAVVATGGTAIVLGVGAVLAGALREALDTNTPDCPEPEPCSASSGGGGTPASRGIGGAPPPGGDGCGNAAGGGGGTALAQNGSDSLAGRYIVKIFPRDGGRALTPFTGATDAGGYFFVPFIPEGEPFTAVAVDTVTGASTTFDGVGSATGASIYMVFDFSNAEDNRFAINLGDTVSNGVPEAGAGNIENPGTFDTYSFTVEADRQVIFDVLSEDPGLSGTRWKLTDPSGNEIFERNLDDTTNILLPVAGTYTLTVGDDNSGGSGIYSFQLIGIPLPDRFTIAIGDAVDENLPGSGSGTIETAYVQDIYSFSGTAGQRVFVDVQNLSGLSQLNWRLEAPDGTEIFDNPLFTQDRGPLTLPQTGSYRIVVGGEPGEDETGTYRFKLWNIPAPQQFAIAIGDAVDADQPAAGAGTIETPGVQDIYSFSGTAGQRVFVDVQNLSGLSQLNWRLEAPDGTEIFDNPLFTQDRGPLTLPQTGSYRIVVGGEPGEDETGTYRFKLWNIPAPQQFAIAIGDTVDVDQPASGAGTIETPGVQDIYSFSGTAGQSVFVDVQALSGLSQLNWRLEAPDGTVIFDEPFFRQDRGPFTLSQTGTYRIIVGGEANQDEVGTYSFQLQLQ